MSNILNQKNQIEPKEVYGKEEVFTTRKKRPKIKMARLSYDCWKELTALATMKGISADEIINEMMVTYRQTLTEDEIERYKIICLAVEQTGRRL